MNVGIGILSGDSAYNSPHLAPRSYAVLPIVGRTQDPNRSRSLTHLGPLLRRQTVRRLGRHHPGASPLDVPAVVTPVAVVEEEHVAVGDPGGLVQALEMSPLVVAVDLAVLDDVSSRNAGGNLPPQEITRRGTREGAGFGIRWGKASEAVAR